MGRFKAYENEEERSKVIGDIDPSLRNVFELQEIKECVGQAMTGTRQ